MKLKAKPIQEKYIWAGLCCLIGLLAVIRMFWNIGGDYFTFLDEYPTFDVAAGFAKTGKFCFWDFHHQVLTDESYTRAWPHTVLLGVWFHIFGINVVAGKTLSAVFGVLFVLSLFYITGKIYENYYISVLACLIVMTNSTVITVFRQIRMYSLWLLLMIWISYFAFQALTVKWYLPNKNKLCFWFNSYLGYSLKYIALFFLFLAAGYYVHINTMIIGAGILCFFLYCLLVKREKRYFCALGLLLLLIVVGLGVCTFILKINWYKNPIFWMSIKGGNIGLREDLNIRYWDWTVDFVHSSRFFWGSLICMAIAFIKSIRKRDRKFDYSMYLFLTVSSSLVCFVYFLTRYYQARYMLYVAPMIAVLMAWGIVETFSVVKAKLMLPLACAAAIVVLGVNVGQTFTEVYFDPDICYHKKVYEIVRDDAEHEMEEGTIPIAGFDFRDYYGVQVFDDYETAAFDRENDMEIWREFSEEYADGYILVESAKINGFPEAMKIFIQDYSEKIAGDGLDHYNIEVVRYHSLDSMSVSGKMIAENITRNGPVTYSFSEDGVRTKVTLEVDTSEMENNVDTLFLKFGIFTTDKETEDKCYQLRLPEQYAGESYYYEIIMEKPCQVVLLKDECMVYYNDGTCREKLLYEK